ncbi:MAG TPA: glycerophosphodiester phosphodiesterase family protein [Baekduia sp.]|uniref:glycerophosphodiester phosphodiesterase family protein n=1 Tax=Baekduia sp. TaxID=2600305 RepID=UPI002B8F3985|nr:glycerophosphodiester phosphodiesterase family protein [Baekduia sp.]HMJ35118.1 glycerophosphodiester phosphodiesterase family protein [Baekduia sp.]
MHRSTRAIAAGLAVAAISSAAPAYGANGFDLEAHRGGRGLRPENTLASFGNALKLGVTTLELDTGVTKDGIVVVSHERRISPLECRDTGPVKPDDQAYPYVGKLVHELTYAQIATLDCGTRHAPAGDPISATQQAVPGTHMPRLAQVFALAARYGAKDVQFNIETKLDPTVPGDTVDPSTFAHKVIDQIRKAHVLRRSLLQSFDWRTLKVSRAVAPSLRRVALAQPANVFPGSKWTAGYQITSNKPFDDGSVASVVAKQLKADVISPVATSTTAKLIKSSHNLKLPVIPWTVNEKADMAKLIDAGVDGLISDYPDRLREVAAAKGKELPDTIASPFDVEAHRGGRGVRPENTLAAFSYALDHHVTTLELDTGVTKDGVLVVSHNRQINPVHCTGPYGNQLIKDLTLAQIKEEDCGHLDPGFPDQVSQGVQRMPTLQEVFDLVRARGDGDVRFNIETKISPTVDDTVPYDQFTAKLVHAIQANDLQDRAMIQSFDWRTIRLSKRLDASIETVALVWQYAGTDCDELADECSLEAVVGDDTVSSPWTGGLDWWDFRDLGKLVRAADADVVSANWQVHDPDQPHVDSPDEYLRTDPAIYHGPTVPQLQDRGLRVVPYTVDDEATMQHVIDLGVDGIISDYPERLQLVAERNGLG